MANVYIEPRPKGRQEESAIDDYVVEDGADQVLKTFKTQKAAIRGERAAGSSPSRSNGSVVVGVRTDPKPN